MSRYSQLYIERGQPVRDSERFRQRLAAFITHRLNYGRAGLDAIFANMGLEIGCQVGRQSHPGLKDFFAKASMPDVLDVITIVVRVGHNPPSDHFAEIYLKTAEEWRAHVQRAFKEENLAYRLGTDDIVHPHVDQEFEANRTAAVAALGLQKFGQARHDFDEAFRHLRNGEGKQAARMMFPAIETAARVLFPGAFTRLGPTEVDRHLVPRLEARYAGNQPAIEAGRQMLEALKKWINASQPYRHGQEVRDPAEPPQDLVVAYLSAGATFHRWMIELADSGTSV
jgi:hypothetical protein